MESFRDLAERTLQHLQKLQVQVIDIAEDFRYRSGVNDNVLQAWLYHIYSQEIMIAECRCVSIYGPKADIINTMIFPCFPKVFPVFSAEILHLGKAKKVVFIDIQTPGLQAEQQSAIASETKKLAQIYSCLPEASKEVPQWAIAYSPGGYVFSKFNGEGFISEIKQAYLDYLDLWICNIPSVSPEECTWAKEQLQQYKQHHVEHSPGPKFLSGIFGTQWSQRFLQEFLYE